jgi:hypothetical protein
MKLEVDPARWDEMLERLGCRDAYYRRGYVDSAAELHPGRAAYLLAGDERGAVVFPCLIREQPESAIRDVTTFAYGGPLALSDDPPVERFFALYEDWCAEQGIVATFARFHPLFENHRLAAPYFHCERVEGSVGWLLDGDLFARMHRHHRRLVRKAQTAGIDVRVVAGAERLDDFAALYLTTMRRVRASDFYFFPAGYWSALERGLSRDVVVFEARLEGRLLASVVCLSTHPWFHYHLGASADEGRKLGASHLLLYSAACFGQEQGFEIFHLGSGVGGGAGELLEFKRRFAPCSPLLEQWFGKAVHDKERYLALTGTDHIRYEGFFPTYLRP